MLLVDGSSQTGLVQNWIEISKMQKKIQKKFFLSEIIASEYVPIICLY